MNQELTDFQAGFRKDRGTRDQMTHIHYITAKARRFQKNLYFCFIGYAKTFDCVAATAAKSLQSCSTLCDPIDGSTPVSPDPGILQARIVEWAAYSFSSRSSWPRNWTGFSFIAGRSFTNWAIKEALVWHHLFKNFPVCCDLYSQRF